MPCFLCGKSLQALAREYEDLVRVSISWSRYSSYKKKKKKSLEDRITESRSLEIFFLRRRGREGGPFGGLEMPRGKWGPCLTLFDRKQGVDVGWASFLYALLPFSMIALLQIHAYVLKILKRDGSVFLIECAPDKQFLGIWPFLSCL